MAAIEKKPTLDELLATKTPQTDWWFIRDQDGKPVQYPLYIAMIALVSVLAMPVAAASLLMLPALTPLLGLAPIVVLATLPWWLHLPLTGKPLLIPLMLVITPFVVLLAIWSLALMPLVLLCLVPIFCLMPFLFASALPLLFFIYTGFASWLLAYLPVPAWMSISWTWPLADGTKLLEQFRGMIKQLFGPL
jgi:hypothetical protein